MPVLLAVPAAGPARIHAPEKRERAGSGTLTERERFRIRLRRRPLLFDGAMGTLLFSRGIPQRACLDELVLTRPEMVAAVHREYLEAGADVIETSTFGANRVRLAPFGLTDSVNRINRRAAQLARESRDVTGRESLVAGSVGPLSPPLHAGTPLSRGAVGAAFREQIEALLEGGVDLFVLETFNELEELLTAIEEVRRASDLPVIAQMTFGEELVATDGTTPEAAAAALTSAGVDALGVNCGVGPISALDALVRTGRPESLVARSIMPNAGLPQRIEGQFVYSADAAYFGEMVPEMVAAGATILGGCCGTTPEHTRAMRAAVDALAPAGTVVEPVAERVPTPISPRSTRYENGDDERIPPSGLARKLANGEFVVSVEIDPPRSIRIERTIEAGRVLQAAGVDVVNISDSAMARVRMGALAVAFGLQHDLDLECVVHMTTRDRNLMALEAELLGAHALGVKNILALTGDPPRVGAYPTGTGVWDVDAIGLIEIIARLNRGEDQAGTAIGQPASFTIACALDPTAADQANEWSRLEQKLAAGAHLIMTQPLYTLEQVESMLAKARERFGPNGFPVPVLLGVLPLHTARHAEFLHHEVPGITIPDEQRAAMHAAGERGAEVGLEMSLALLEQVDGLVQGTYIMPSFGRYEQAAELVRRIRTRRAAAAG